VVKTLSDPIQEARHTAAQVRSTTARLVELWIFIYSLSQVLAKIALIELPRDQWPDLMAMLLNHMTTSDNNLKESTLEALGYICEEIVQPIFHHIIYFTLP